MHCYVARMKLYRNIHIIKVEGVFAKNRLEILKPNTIWNIQNTHSFVPFFEGTINSLSICFMVILNNSLEEIWLKLILQIITRA